MPPTGPNNPPAGLLIVKVSVPPLPLKTNREAPLNETGRPALRTKEPSVALTAITTRSSFALVPSTVTMPAALTLLTVAESLKLFGSLVTLLLTVAVLVTLAEVGRLELTLTASWKAAD